MKKYPLLNKLTKKYILENSLHIGEHKKKRFFLNKKTIYNTNKIDILKINNITLSIKKFMSPLLYIAAKKGNIWLIESETQWQFGQLSNIKQHPKKQKFPSFIVILHDKNFNYILNEIFNLTVPTIVATSSHLDPTKSFYQLPANTNNKKALKFTSKLINNLIKIAYLRRLSYLKKKKITSR